MHVRGTGQGQVLVTAAGNPLPLLRCATDRCAVEVAPGTEIRITTVLGEGATFAGYGQMPMRTPSPLVPYLGDPLARCNGGDGATAIAASDVLDCSFRITADTEIAAILGEVPEEVMVALDDVALDTLVKPLTPKAPPPPIEAEKLESLQVALAPPPRALPPPMLPPPLPPPPPPPDEAKQPPPPVPPNMTMVEVKDDKHEVDKAVEDAKLLSDKNRDVEEETRATETNLDKESDGKEVASKESEDTTSAEIGGPDDKIRQLEETEKTTDERVKETDHSGDDKAAKGEITGEAGQGGEDGTGGEKTPGKLSMRGIEGRGSVTEQGDGQKQGSKGTPGINSPLAFEDYERIMGKEKVDDERQVAARKMSSKKGRWERKLDAVKSSLENFVPDIRPGNQTALKTRAQPFALYVVRMHRRIHELWGFGFLESLDDKPADYPLNNPDLWVNIEMSINEDGTVHKVTIAHTSGKTEFDVAAVDTVLTAAPYEATPEAIRSVDGRVYLRWGFYRNWKQCGTFNVEPYILTSVPDDDGNELDDGAMVRNVAKLPGKKQAPVGQTPVTPDDSKGKGEVSPATSVKDKQAVFAANLWVSAFATAQVDKLVKYSQLPFYAGGQIAAQTAGDLKDMYSGLIVESGPMKDWKLLTPGEYGTSGAALPAGNLVVQVRTSKSTFAIVLTKTKSGEFRATQLAR